MHFESNNLFLHWPVRFQKKTFDSASCSRTRLHGRVVKGVGHLGHVEVMEAGGCEFDPRPGHYSRMSF